MRTTVTTTRSRRSHTTGRSGSSARLHVGPAGTMSAPHILRLQRLAGNGAVTAWLQREKEDAHDPAALTQKADEIRSDEENALGQRIELSPELVSAAAGAPTSDKKEQEPDYDQVTKKGAQHGKAFGSGDLGLDPGRVAQGYIGDCYLMSAIAAVARANPDAIRKLIKPVGKDRYEVSLYEHRWLLADPVHTEVVDTTVPEDRDGKPLYGSGQLIIKGDLEADRPLWPLIIEKAYAQWKGGYNKMGHGGYASEALEALTGHEASEKKTSDYSPEKIGQMIEKDIKAGKALEASTGNMPPDITPLGTKGNAGEHEGMVGNNKVVFNHAYSIENVETPVGTIDLQNPWGHDHIEDMSLGEFKHCFWSWDEENTR